MLCVGLLVTVTIVYLLVVWVPGTNRMLTGQGQINYIN